VSPVGDRSLREQLSYRVRRDAHRAGIPQAELAARAGLTPKHVSQVLSGKADGSFEAWEKLAEVLGRSWHVELW
jgi:transcriptional regulator with XRE-family HTH domain